MNPDSPEHAAQPDQRISSLVNEYFDRRQIGEDLTPERFAGEHPELAKELRPYLEGLALIEKARTLASGAGLTEAASAGADLPTIEGYELIEEIGRGGMGVVYKALQVSTKRTVVLKVMLAGPFASPSARRRFEREVQLAARLQHPGIVGVLESGEVSGQRYYAMDYVAGVRLDRYLSSTQPDVRAILSLFVRICEAVEYAHGHNVVHRDLKPANVLIDADGNPHVVDFGLAKATDQVDSEEALTTCVSLTGQVLGTLFYLSPEQAAGTPDEIDARTDVYSLGVVLYEALTGSLPLDTSGRPSEVLRRILDVAPASPSSRSDRVDADLETIVLKALEKERARRYQSAREMAADIGRYLDGEPILARRPSSLYILRKKLVKHRTRVVLVAVALALVLAGLLSESWSRRREWAAARRAAETCQRNLEEGTDGRAAANARALYQRHPELPEASLVWARAQYDDERSRSNAIPFLEGQLGTDASEWPWRTLLADMYLASGDAERAGALLAQAEREAPDTAEAWYLRTFATLDPRRALHCAEQAIDRDPSHRLAWRRLTYLRLQSDDLDGALAAADRLIGLGEGAYEWTLFKAQVLARQGSFRKAVEQYTRLTTIKPNNASTYVYRAHAWRRINEHARAVADYTRAIELHGDLTANIWLRYQRATPLWILGRVEEALEDYRRFRIVHGQPFYADARRFLILRELGRQSEAAEALDAALRDVEKPSWLHQIFRCLAGQLTPEELAAAARDDREQLCEAYYYAGEACLLSKRPDEARKWFELCVRTGVQFDLNVFPLTPMNEYELAQWRLKSLRTGGQPASLP